MSEEVEMHVYKAWHFRTPTQFYPKLGPKVKFYYKTGYTRYIPGIYYTYTMQKSGSSLLSCPSALGSLRPGLPLDLLSFGHREAAHSRLGQSKVPQPGVELVNMAAPPRDRAHTIGTAAHKSILLSAAVLVWNG
jgi:hypothetical protein